ncbi:LIN-7 protein, partial [Aphelenchoides avenae]
MSQLLRARGLQILAMRTKFAPPKNMPYAGIYRQEGETVRKDDLLVVQRRMNYHPGANVYHMPDRRRHLLKADCDGTVMITREKAEVDPSIKEMQTEYEYRNYEGLYKLTFHVIPSDMSNRRSILKPRAMGEELHLERDLQRICELIKHLNKTGELTSQRLQALQKVIQSPFFNAVREVYENVYQSTLEDMEGSPE